MDKEQKSPGREFIEISQEMRKAWMKMIESEQGVCSSGNNERGKEGGGRALACVML